MVVLSVASFSVRVGRDAFKVRAGKLTWTEFRARAGGHVFGIGLGVAGAAVGAAAGSVVPVVGTILGGFAGSLVGEAAGSKLGASVVEVVEGKLRTPKAGRNPDLETPKRHL
jgi:phage tail tape-measure protein